mgnify:CR=1 FL=1
MRFIKAQRTSRGINADTKGLNIDALGLATINTDKALIPPKGDQNARPFTPVEGMLRYNTDVTNFEVYQNSAWKPIRFKEPITITQQNLGNGKVCSASLPKVLFVLSESTCQPRNSQEDPQSSGCDDALIDRIVWSLVKACKISLSMNVISQLSPNLECSLVPF